MNAGTLSVSSGGQLWATGATFDNTGLISITGAGSEVVINAQNFTEQGSITVSNGATLALASGITAPVLESIHNAGGLIELDGTLTNSGTLDIGTAAPALILEGEGTIEGGTVTGESLTFAGGTLSNVTFRGPLDLTRQGETLNITGSFAAQSTDGSAQGTLNLTGENASLDYGAPVLNDVLLNIGRVGGEATLINGNAGSLTLTSSTSVSVEGRATFEGSGMIMNEGTITVDTNSHFIVESGFTNENPVLASGTDAYLNSVSSTNAGSITIANGGKAGFSSIDNTGTITITAASAGFAGITTNDGLIAF